ncbi:MAG: CPBP family intramembrane metalloprotease [Oscillospiraceae bacterium]|nr:CPBP family intramembrane metalloprotease [Oscillospiraceae bacterium]
MREYIKNLGDVFIILIVGMCPMGLGVIYSALSSGGEYEGIIMSAALLAGAFLCLLVMKRQYGISIGEHSFKPEIKTSVLAVTAALFYELTALLTIYKPILTDSDSGGLSPLEIAEWAAAVIIAPAAEELIFRFSMLSLLFGKSKGRFQKAVSIMMISLLWTVIHLSGSLLRLADIFLVGILLGIIYLKYKNIFYCIFFHAAANFAAGIPETFLINNGYILYISLPLCLAVIWFLIFSKKKTSPENR